MNVPIPSDADVLSVSAHSFLTKEGGKEHLNATKHEKPLRERLLCLRSGLNVAFHMCQIFNASEKIVFFSLICIRDGT